MSTHVQRYPPTDELSRLIDRLRAELRDQHRVFGALFIAQPDGEGGHDHVLVFADNCPQEVRATLLADLKKAVDAAEKRFKI